MAEGKEANVVEVIPLVRGIPKATLSYFTTEAPALGSFVRVPVRSGETLGVVASVKDARSARSELRNASFTLKKMSPPKKGGGFSPAFIRAAERTARFYAATTGSVLGTIVTKFFLAEPELLRDKAGHEPVVMKTPGPKGRALPEALLMQAETEERFGRYFGLVRESFARKASVLFVVPTREDGERAFKELSRGIEEYAFFFHAGEKPKALKETVIKAKKETHPILFITTPAGLAFERADFGLIILERESSRAYRTLARPYIDARYFVRALAEESNRTLILGDSVLSVETLYRESARERSELLPLKWRLTAEARTELVDMKATKEFRVFSPELEGMIRRASEDHAPVFLFGARKGLSPTTACRDCGSVLACQNCGAPVVLHAKGDARVYVCHACGAKRSAETVCDTCHSWRLEPLGIGTDMIADVAAKLMPGSSIFILDKDHAPTPARAKALVKRMLAERAPIIVGTELAFSYLGRVPYVGLVSADALFSVPDFRIHERIFMIVARLRELATQEVIIQTRNIGKEIVDWAAKGNVSEFYKAEILDRETFLYPPFTVFITVAIQGAAALEKHASDLARSFAAWQPDFLRVRAPKGRTELRMVIRLPRTSWPDDKLLSELLLLPPDFSIKVDPESIL